MIPFHPLILALVVSAVFTGVVCVIWEIAFRATRSRASAKQPRGFEVKQPAGGETAALREKDDHHG